VLTDPSAYPLGGDVTISIGVHRILSFSFSFILISPPGSPVGYCVWFVAANAVGICMLNRNAANIIDIMVVAKVFLHHFHLCFQNFWNVASF